MWLRLSMFGEQVYYLAARTYQENSAGVKAMHVLCHLLNTIDQKAFLVPIDKTFLINPRLNTPVISKELHTKHVRDGINVIAVYDESVPGNPLRAATFVRWFLNSPSFLGGKSEASTDGASINFVFANEINQKLQRLYVNTIDFDFFLAAPKFEHRPLTLFYGGKSRALGIKVEKPEGAIEIHRTGPKRQSREELRILFSRAHMFYVAEDTAMVLEAALCGCSSIQLKKYFTKPPLSQQDGGVGLVDSESNASEISKEFLEKYICTLRLRELEDVSKFIIATKVGAKKSSRGGNLDFRFGQYSIWKIQYYKAKAGFRASGLKGIWAVINAHRLLKKDKL
jgi:hypothetical protein